MAINTNQIFKTIEELAQSDLDLEEKLKKVTILIISNDSNTRDGIALDLQKKGFQRIISAKNTLETVRQLKEKKGITGLLKLSISDLDIGEKYFNKEDFDNVEGFDSKIFWKNCIEEKIMTIIGDIGIPISYEEFIRKIETFGTVDDSLHHKMNKITDKAKTFDSKKLITLLEEKNLINQVNQLYIVNNTDDQHFVKLNKELTNQGRYKMLKAPVNVDSVYELLIDELKKIINRYADPADIKSIEVELPLSKAQKEELMTTFQQVNQIIDIRAKKIGEKYSEKLNQDQINKIKKKIYRIMAYYAVKNELEYFHYFVWGLKGVFSLLENETKNIHIRQVFLFNNIMSALEYMHYEVINNDIKQCGSIVFVILKNFTEIYNKGNKIAGNLEPMLFYRSLGILFLWPAYASQFIQILKINPDYYSYFSIKENESKMLDAQNYQNLQRRFISFTEKVFQVEKCSN